MQEERGSLSYISKPLSFEHTSSNSSSDAIEQHWDNIGDNDLQDYINSESVNDSHRFTLGESSSRRDEQRRNEIIDLDPDDDDGEDEDEEERPSNVNQVNLNADYIELQTDTNRSVEGGRKRKAPEGGYYTFHRGESSSSSRWSPASTVYRPGNGLNINGGVAPITENSNRNSSDQLETVSPAVVRQQHDGLSLPTYQQNRQDYTIESVFPPRNLYTSSMTVPPPPSMAPPFQWNDVTQQVNRSSLIRVDEFRNAARAQRNRNATSANLNIGSSSSTTNVQPSSSLTAFHNAANYQRRRSELVRRSLISSLAVDDSHNTNDRSLAPPASPDRLVLPPVVSDNSQAYSRAGRWSDSRQGELPHPLRTLGAAAASRGRNRLMVSQMQSVLEAMRRDNNLRIEDVMLLNHSMMFEGAAADRYRDMRLDVDNMSYEELLALEERIGDVCTGVNEETISTRLKQGSYKSGTKSLQDAEPCCICQEEYIEGVDMGTLECGHEFHSHCIKEWLKQKNLCPICKTTGLNTSKKRKIG